MSPAPPSDASGLLIRLDAARDLPDGSERIDRLARLATEADAAGATRLALTIRLDLLDTLDRAGHGWWMPPVLRRCRTVADADPAVVGAPAVELLDWYQRRIVALAAGTPRIALAEARALLADLERRRSRSGDPRAVLDDLWCELADQAGDEPGRADRLARWLASDAEPTGECAACAACRRAEMLADRGTWTPGDRDAATPVGPGTGAPPGMPGGRAADAAAIRAVEPVLRGRPDCPEQPERALAAAMLPYLRLGRHAEAAAAHVTAYRRHRTERAAFPRLASHLRFCALAGHPDRGLEILIEHLPRLAGPVDDRSVMEFTAAGALVCRTTADPAGRPDRPDAPADAMPAGRPDRPDIIALGADLLGSAGEVARRFDARNGTGHQSRRLAAWLAEPPAPAVVPLPPDEASQAADDPESPAGKRSPATSRPPARRP